MKLLTVCCLLLIGLASASAIRRHRSAQLYPDEGLYYPQEPSGYSYVERLYPRPNYYPSKYYPKDSLNSIGAPLVQHHQQGGPVVSGSICGPCGTSLSGHVGCGCLGGSLFSPLGSLSGGIGHPGPISSPLPPPIHSLPSQDPCLGRGRSRGSIELDEVTISASLAIIDYLIANSHEIGIFRYPGRMEIKRKLEELLEAGDVKGLKQLLVPGLEIEASEALRVFIRKLRTPIFPVRVEKLISAKNDVPNEMIAVDALGLIYEELSGDRLTLVQKLLELLYLVSKNTSRTELSTISVAVNLLQLFFHTEVNLTSKWQQVSLIFHEMIILSQERVK